VEPSSCIRDVNLFEQLDRTLARVFPIHSEMASKRFGELRPDRQRRVQRGHRVLEDHPDLVSSDVLELLLAQLQQVAPLEAAVPSTTRPGGWTSPMRESIETDLPQPDSPTIPSIFPASTSKETPSPGRASPGRVLKKVWRSLPSSSAMST